MALIKFGGGVVQMAGSIGGTTFARNRYGNYARARTKPTNPNSSGQQIVRATLTQLTTRWSTILTAVQRTAWNLYGASVVMTNRLGENIQLSGFNHYVRSNSLIARVGGTHVDDGPTLFELPQADATFAVTATEAAQTIDVTYDDSAPWANEDDGHMFTFQGSPQNAQRNFFAGPWNFLGQIEGALAVPPVSPDTQPVVTAIAEGQRQWVYARIMRADGRLSAPFRADTFTAA